MVQKFAARGIKVPGYAITNRASYWLWPAIVPDITLCSELLNKRGVDSYLGATQLRKVLPVAGSACKSPSKMIAFFDQVRHGVDPDVL